MQADRLIVVSRRPFDLDAAVRRRFEKRIYIPLPDKEARLRLFESLCPFIILLPPSVLGLTRLHILEVHLGDERMVLSRRQLDHMARLAQGFSGSDIGNVCRDALMEPGRQLH